MYLRERGRDRKREREREIEGEGDRKRRTASALLTTSLLGVPGEMRVDLFLKPGGKGHPLVRPGHSGAEYESAVQTIR